MDEKLVETVARAIAEIAGGGTDDWSWWTDEAHAAIAAIEKRVEELQETLARTCRTLERCEDRFEERVTREYDARIVQLEAELDARGKRIAELGDRIRELEEELAYTKEAQ